MPTPPDVDAYLAALPDDRRVAMETLRRTIRAAAPDAVELISYQMPAFKTHGQFLVSYASFKKHYSLFPASDAVVQSLGGEVAPYLFGSGTIRFAADQPIPVDTVRKIVTIRVGENDEAAARKR